MTMGNCVRYRETIRSRQMEDAHTTLTRFCFMVGARAVISIQKPLGLVLEPLGEDEQSGVVVVEVGQGSNADRAGVAPGDVLLAVNNLDLRAASLDAVIDAIGATPGRVLNLRFQRDPRE